MKPKPPTWPLYRLTETEDPTWQEIVVRGETMHGRQHVVRAAKLSPGVLSEEEAERQLNLVRQAVLEEITSAIEGEEKS